MRPTGAEVQGVWGTWPIRPTGYGVQGVWGTWGMGHMGNRPQWVQGVWGSGGMGYRGYGIQGVWATWVMGHMGNGAHGQWGTWAMGHMGNGAHGQWGSWAMGPTWPLGDWDIFAYNFIITGWILTKILLDIDIDVFYLNTERFFHDGSIKGIFSMDFHFLVCCLLASSLLRSPHYIFRNSILWACTVMTSSRNRDLNKKAKMASPTSKIKTLITRLHVNILRRPFGY